MSDNTDIQPLTCALWFSILRDARFLSHRDILRLWQRALLRSHTPLRFSQGFNPHPRLSLPLPRSVGVAGLTELLIIETDTSLRPADLKNNLQPHLTRDITLHHVQLLKPRSSFRPAWAHIALTLADHTDKDTLRRRLDDFFQQPCLIHRPRRGRHPAKNFDARPLLKHLHLYANTLRCTLAVEPTGSVRIDELRRLLDLDRPEDVTNITRTAVGWHLVHQN